MKEVWKTFVATTEDGGNLIIHICTDGYVYGIGSYLLTSKQKEELRQFYKKNYIKPTPIVYTDFMDRDEIKKF